MSTSILSLEDAVAAFSDPELRLYGVRCIAGDALSDPNGADMAITADGMFALRTGAVSFRARVQVEVEVLRELWIDVIADFSAPEDYSIGKDAFLSFANQVAAPQLRSYAQAILDPLLVAAGFPAGILPPMTVLDVPMFRGEHLPEALGPAIMGELRELLELQVPDIQESVVSG